MKIIRVLLMGFIVIAALAAQMQKATTGLPTNVQRAPLQTSLPKISGANPDCYAAHCTAMGVSGTNFGATQGTRRLLFDGVQPKITTWQNNMLGFEASKNLAFWPVHHTLVITDETGKPLSNTYDFVMLYWFDGAEPNHAKAGTEIRIHSWCAGPQAGKSLWMGTTPMTITFWTSTDDCAPIRAIVPSLPPGTYPITMHSGSQQVSKSSISFKID